ncbi:MAG: hypothetical protein BWY17_00292 [Deltaproteobacteria bacterium ADurb.Bin207]|jgi:hypothetical protein|nr:MAG: hypothetical protein BWY17_00292 [Deltaproteobacteria bacterium ADurb.Bin207]
MIRKEASAEKGIKRFESRRFDPVHEDACGRWPVIIGPSSGLGRRPRAILGHRGSQHAEDSRISPIFMAAISSFDGFANRTVESRYP